MPLTWEAIQANAVAFSKRWKDAATVLNQPVRGVRVSKNGDAFSYQVADVASRTFQERNYYWPFSRAEITNSNGALIQNDGY